MWNSFNLIFEKINLFDFYLENYCGWFFLPNENIKNVIFFFMLDVLRVKELN